MNIIETLEKTKSFIDAPHKWIQCEFAVDEDMNPLNPLFNRDHNDDPIDFYWMTHGSSLDAPLTCKPVCFCLIGAIRQATQINEPAFKEAVSLLREILPVDDPDTDISEFNDSPAVNHKDIMLLLNNAINLAKFRKDLADIRNQIAQLNPPLNPEHVIAYLKNELNSEEGGMAADAILDWFRSDRTLLPKVINILRKFN